MPETRRRALLIGAPVGKADYMRFLAPHVRQQQG